MLGGGGDGEEGQGEHGQGGPPVPGVPAADLVLIQPGQSLAGLEILLRGPADPGDLDQGGQRDVAGAVAAVERQLPGAAVAADQQPAVTGPAGVDGQPGPVVVAVALGALARGVPLPRPAGQAGGDLAGLAGARARWSPGGWRPPPARSRSGGVPGQRAGPGRRRTPHRR